MQATKAIVLSLGELDIAAISKYEFALVVYRIYCDKVFKGESVNLSKDTAKKTDVAKHLGNLLEEGVLFPLKNVPDVFVLLGRSDAEVEDIACSIDPFCYMSHLSAMSYHGITDRIPNKLFISSPSAKDWRVFAEKQMKKDLGDGYTQYRENGLPALARTRMAKIRNVEIHNYSSSHLGAYKNVRGRSLRVSTIGRTFLDMLREPSRCGGMNHVINVFEQYSNKYLRLITDEIDRNGAPIDKVRAGYVLDEIVEVKNEVVEEWSSFAQRGGSRKLDPSAEYVAEWSDKWKISLNVIRNRNEQY